MNVLYFDTPTLLPSYRIFKFLESKVNFDYAIATKSLDNFPDYEKLLELAMTPGGIDNFVMVNCSPAFMIPEIRRFIGFANYNANHSIFVQNDYSIKPPSQCKSVPLSEYLDYKAECKAFYGFDLWSTCSGERNSLGPNQIFEYVDWNKVVYTGAPDVISHKDRKSSLLYFGSYRNDRTDKYSHYLDSIEYEVDIYCPTTVQSKKFRNLIGESANYLLKIYPDTMKQYRASVIMQDNKSTRNFHSMPTRFYECLNCGVAMIFDPDCKMTLDKAGITGYEPYMTDSQSDIADIIADSETVAREQARLWNKDYLGELENQLSKALEHYPTLNLREDL